jgi:hypothetical protein
MVEADDIRRDDERGADQLHRLAGPDTAAALAECSAGQRVVGPGVEQDLRTARVEALPHVGEVVEVRAHVRGLDAVGDEAGGTCRIDVSVLLHEGVELVEFGDEVGQFVG